MVLGALIDAGVPIDGVRRALGQLAVDAGSVWTERVVRAGVTATRFCVAGEEPPADHADDHGHEHGRDGPPHHHPSGEAPDEPPTAGGEQRHYHVHRSLDEIARLIDGSSLSAAGKSRARDLFRKLGEAESAIHGVPLDRVHLHEVGALDSIVDIAGTVFAMEYLGIDRVVASPLNVGGGAVRSAHGVYPVPAPATARLLRGAPIYAGSQQVELVTPTGALLVTAYASSYGPIPPMRLEAVGYGAGTRDLPDRPNVLRVLVGEASEGAPRRTVAVMEAEIDDMTPQLFGTLMERLLDEGALDVFYTPIQMKKNRPGTLLTILASPESRERLTATVFRETTTIGVRYSEMQRDCLDRETAVVATPFGDVRIKIARRGTEVVNASPEFDDCVRLASAAGRAVKDVHAAAVKAFLDLPPVPPT